MPAERDARAMSRIDLGNMSATQRERVMIGAFPLLGAMGKMFYESKSRNGVPWDKAPLPRRWHRCAAWTSEWFGLSQVLHCACGAVMDGVFERRWIDKNARRRKVSP